MRFVVPFLFGLTVALIPTGPTQAQTTDADKALRAAQIKQVIAELKGRIAELEAELARLQPSDAAHAANEQIPVQPPRLDDWPMYGYDAGNTFCNRHETSLAPPLVKAWDVSLGGHLDGVTVSSGIALVAVSRGRSEHRVYALNAENGRRLWTFTLPGGGGGSIGMSPARSGDLVFFGGQQDKSVYAVHLQTGELRWQHDEIRSMLTASPKIGAGTLYINSNQSGLWAFDPITGNEKWRNEGCQSDIAVAGGNLLRPGGAYGGGLLALDAQSGAQSWYQTAGYTRSQVAANDDLTFVTYAGETPVEVVVDENFKRFQYDRIAAFGTRDGNKVWETALQEDAYDSGLLLLGDVLYVAVRGGSIHCLDAQTGKIRTQRRFTDGLGRLIATSNVIFATSRLGVMALAPDTLETLWATPTRGFPELVVANGRLYVATGPRIAAFANAKHDSND